jgi:hypothetical protein
MFKHTTNTNPTLSNWPLHPERNNKPFDHQVIIKLPQTKDCNYDNKAKDHAENSSTDEKSQLNK